ncbi:alpha/beta hydrolase [Saccharomonospora sp. NPDC006951]
MAEPPRFTRSLRVERQFVGGFPSFTLSPEKGPVSRLRVMHLHGGGYVEQIARHHWRFATRLVRELGCAVTLPIYPLAPHHDHRDVLPMVWRAYEHHLAPFAEEHRVVSGDSAGGGLCLALAQTLRERGEPQPARMALFSPWLDLSLPDPLSNRIEPADPMLGVAGLRQAGRWYAAEDGLADPKVSPVYADLSGFGPIAVFIGTRDVLLPESRRLREDAEAKDVPLRYHEYPGMFHNWIMQPVPEASEAMRELVSFLTTPTAQSA